MSNRAYSIFLGIMFIIVQTTLVSADNVVLIGYWPPTNEMLRPWSNNPAQNPSGWQGQNWRGLGHNVFSFFPEFPPDGDPFNDPFGSDGWVGSPESDFRVDYQDTSSDFWRVMDALNPTAIVSFSWGGFDNRWEIERVEGGHSGGQNPANDWTSDGHGPEFFPTQSSIDSRSWDAISMYRNGLRLESQLPVDEIVAATSKLGLANVFVDETGTSGNYLSGFLGLHSLYYNSITQDNLVAGHIHVGSGLSILDATALTEATLTEVLREVNRQQVPEPGSLILLLCAASIHFMTRRRATVAEK